MALFSPSLGFTSGGREIDRQTTQTVLDSRGIQNICRIARVVVSIVVLGATQTTAEERAVQLAGIDVTVWSQTIDDVHGQSVLIFSHGFHGCATQSRFLMEALAAAAYLVLAPNHRDATCNGGHGHWFEQPQIGFWKPENWNEATFEDRGEDVRHVAEAARVDDRFRHADWSRLGLVGHSLGGYTMLALEGAWPQWKRRAGVKAVLALSPYTQPFIVHGTLERLAVPVMYQGGTHDFGITPAIAKAQGAYDQSPEPKYLVVIDKAGHLAWTDLGRAVFRKPIVDYSVAFLNRYVKGQPAEPLLSQSGLGISLFRHPPTP
jgi:pimeloyl-ACP methyl ester carboxylesterase